MAFCSNCGKELNENAAVCLNCGVAVGQESKANAAQETAENVLNTPDTTAEFDPQDIAANKGLTVLSYFGWLLLIPLIAISSKSKFARFHVNQGLVLAIIEVIWGVLSSVVTNILGAILGTVGLHFIVTILSALFSLVNLLFLALSIIGIVNVVNGKAKELPVIGKYQILK